MTRRAFGFLLVFLLSAPLTAQTPWQPLRTPDGQPDMQGIWRFDPGPKPEGPGGISAMVSLEGERGPLWQDMSQWLQAETTVSGFKMLAPSYVVDPPDGKIPYQPWTTGRRREFFANQVTPTKREHIDPNMRAAQAVLRICADKAEPDVSDEPFPPLESWLLLPLTHASCHEARVGLGGVPDVVKDAPTDTPVPEHRRTDWRRSSRNRRVCPQKQIS